MADAPKFCYSCGSPLGDGVLDCPACHQLVYAAEFDELANQARALETAGNLAAAAALWGKALALLPAESQPAASIRDHRASLGALSRTAGSQSSVISTPTAIQPAIHSAMQPAIQPATQPFTQPLTQPLTQTSPAPAIAAHDSPPDSEKPAPDWKKRLGPFGVLLAFLAKFKTAALLLLTKGKFLLFGLTKLNTLLTMFASMALYWALYGWKFGVGFVLGIYVHEMGHVWALKHFGLRASAPMFIPGLGAFVSLYDSPANVGQDARIGLAGPIWGTSVAIVFRLAGILSGGGLWLALAHVTAYINLFNLIPIWQLDGGRGFRALDRQQRLLSVGIMAAMWYFTDAGMYLILAAGAAYRIFWAKDHPAEGDRGALVQYVGLLITLGALLARIG